MSELRDPRLGFTDERGEQMPLVSISGAPYSERGGGVHGLDNGYFVILDAFPRADFDLAAIETELLTAVAQPIAPVKKSKASHVE